VIDPGQINILVVDDDDGGRYVKAHTLAAQGYAISEAADGETTLAMVAAAPPPDLILLDVRLTDSSGIDISRKIKATLPQVAILQTSSAVISPHDRVVALDAGADAYLIEPIEPDELIAVVKALLRMRHAEQALRQSNEALEARVAVRTEELAESYRLLMAEQAGRRETENILWHTQKLEAVGRLTGGIAHDFNNLLTIITGNLELLEHDIDRDAGPSTDRRLQQIAAALRAAEHGAEMTQQLLAFARRGVLRARTVDLGKLIGEMGDFLRRTVGASVVVDIAAAPELWPCHLDPVQFEAAILNLAINARDAMPEGGRIQIVLSNVEVPADTAPSEAPAGSYVRVHVIDNGQGMDSDIVDRAFEPFFTTKNIGEGSGLGLSQVYGFVSQSGGEVKIASTPGIGTIVTLYLPRGDAQARDDENAADIDDVDPRGDETILVVEDEDQVRAVAVQMIEDLGYKAVEAADAAEALKLLCGPIPIDLLFSDILMPGGMSGLTLATQARQIKNGLPVLLTSGYPAENRDTAARSEFAMIQKPYRRDALAQMLRSTLSFGQSAGSQPGSSDTRASQGRVGSANKNGMSPDPAAASRRRG
jgi:signal transduction histidine kinase